MSHPALSEPVVAIKKQKKLLMKTIYLNTLAILVTLFLGVSCTISVDKKTENPIVKNLNLVTNSTQPIRNGILLEAQGGVKVETAFLMLADGALISEDNTIKVGDKIKLILKVSGWEASNGQVRLGAGEQLMNSEEREMMSSNDLFAKNDLFAEEDAKIITLVMEVLNTATIYDFYKTNFRIWNKNANQFINGQYRFKIMKP